MRWLMVLAACGGSGEDKPAGAPPPPPSRPAALPAGPVPVSLPALAPAQRRTLNDALGYLIIDAHGGLAWGFVGKDAPFAAHPMKRGELAHEHVMRGEPEARFATGLSPEPGRDIVGELSHAPGALGLVIADAAAPARLVLSKGLVPLGKATIAGGAANAAVLYAFSTAAAEPATYDLVLRVEDLAPLTGAHPSRVLLEIGDASTTAQLVAALGALGEAGVATVRLHRMMGWGDIPVAEIADVAGVSEEDDAITKGEPATVEIGEPTVDAALDQQLVGNALKGEVTRFRYCYEKRGLPKLHGAVTASFDVGADGEITNRKATGLDPKIASCVAGALFDLEIAPGGVHGAGHARVAIAFNAVPPPPAPEKIDGWWCTTFDETGACGRSPDRCEDGRTFYLSEMQKHGYAGHATDCTHQATAWTSDGEAHYPTKALCAGACRQEK